MAFFSRSSRENWLTSSISAPARSIVDGIANRLSIGVGTIAPSIGASSASTS